MRGKSILWLTDMSHKIALPCLYRFSIWPSVSGVTRLDIYMMCYVANHRANGFNLLKQGKGTFLFQLQKDHPCIFREFVFQENLLGKCTSCTYVPSTQSCVQARSVLNSLFPTDKLSVGVNEKVNGMCMWYVVCAHAPKTYYNYSFPFFVNKV